MVEHHRLGEVVMLTLIDHLHDFHFIFIFAFHACLYLEMLVGRLPPVGPRPGQAGGGVGAPGDAPADTQLMRGEEQRIITEMQRISD